MTIIAVFRSRSQCLDFGERLKTHGVSAEIVSAPQEARIGCGLCVRFDSRQFIRARAVLHTARYSAFKGFYKMEFTGGRVSVVAYHGGERE